MRQRMKQLHKRLPALALAVLLLLCCAPFALAAEDSGTCGANLTWTLSGDTLTIEGSGAMYDFPETEMAPWYGYRHDIARVVLPDGLTRVGDLAFYECTDLSSIILPDSVTTVGWYAFAGCTAVTMLDLSDSLQVIGEGAFRECSSLPSVRLPDSLTTLEFQAFYRCESLTEIVIPASVTELGMTTFAYCYDLVRAEIQAPIEVLPDWTFYGCERLTDVILPDTLTGANEYAFYDCDSLSNVEYHGSEENRKQIEEDIERDLEGDMGMGSVSDTPTTESTSNTVYTEEEETGTITAETTTVVKTESADVSTSVTIVVPNGNLDDSTTSAQVNVTLETASDWNEVAETVTEVVTSTDTVQVDVYVKDDTVLSAENLDALAGEDVTVAVHTASGANWKVDCSTLEQGTLETDIDLSYERSDAPQETVDELEGAVTYLLKFASSARINAEVMVKLPRQYATQTAYLYQRMKGELEFLQAVVIDHNGYAHFYLGSVDSETEYIVGINVPNADAAEAIVPTELYADYGITENMKPVEYVITGRTSSWGMTGRQVTWILAGVMAVCVISIGVVMFALNKRKLKMGYVPDLDDEEY